MKRYYDPEIFLQMLDGNTSMDELKERFEAEYPPQKITLDELQQFLGAAVGLRDGRPVGLELDREVGPAEERTDEIAAGPGQFDHERAVG